MTIYHILDYLYPPRCPVCETVHTGGICKNCREHLPFIRENFCLKCGKPLKNPREEYCLDCQKKSHVFLQGRSLFSYQGALRRSVYKLKYKNRREYAVTYGREMAHDLGPWIRQVGITVILPIPLHKNRQRYRGYNQAELLAAGLAEELHLSLERHVLYRKKETTPQKELDSGSRRKNLSGAFVLRGSLRRNDRVLLVDDIYTTGSTVDAAALCLKEAGITQIYVITLAIGG